MGTEILLEGWRRKRKVNKQGKVPVLKKPCTLLNPDTGFKNILWTVFKFSTQMLSSFAFTRSWHPYLFCSLWLFKKENEKGRKQESGKNQTAWKENSGLAQQQSDFSFFFLPNLAFHPPKAAYSPETLVIYIGGLQNYVGWAPEHFAQYMLNF